MKKIIVFASGTKDGGGSGFQELVENSCTGVLRADIVAVISNHAEGGVKRRAEKFKIPFFHYADTWVAHKYRLIVEQYGADFVVLSGWLKKVTGLDSTKTINIHPGSLPRFGGKGMYGCHVHEKVITAFDRGEIKATAVSMHFVTREYDKGPIFFRYPVLIRQGDTYKSLGERVNKVEHAWQSWVTSLVVNGEISWDGQDAKSLVVPSWYRWHEAL